MHIYVLIYTYTHVNMYTYIHIQIYTYIWIYIYIYFYQYIHTYIYIYIYIYKEIIKQICGILPQLGAILNKSWRQHPTRHQLYVHLLPITKTIQVRRTRHAGHCWRSKDELISDVLLWTPTYGQAKAGRPARPAAM